MATPLRYPGGKSKTYKLVEYLIKENNCTSYAEPYAGGAGVAVKLLLNNRVDRILLNDYDKSIYCFWESAINYTEKFIELIEQTEVNIENWYKMKKIQESKHSLDLEVEENIISLGFSTFFLNRTNRSGIIKAGVIGGKAQNGNYLMDCRFNKVNLIQRIKEISKFRNRILIYNKDAEDFIKNDLSKAKGCFVFIDPPYINKGYQLYTNFYNEDDHVNLAKSIKKHLDKKDWILTYDIDELLEDLYSEYESENYYINYSVHNPRKGVEKIIFSKNLKKNKYSDYIKLAKI